MTSLHVEATGARGASDPAGASGGYGAVATGTLDSITPGSVLYVEVGGAGDPGCFTSPDNDTNCAGGFNGGGRTYYAGPGGGASDVRTVATPPGTDPSSDATSLNSRLLVAGGAGGAGGTFTCAAGKGGDGASMGGNGAVCEGTSAGTGGGAGTSTAGGQGGAGDPAGGLYGPGDPGYFGHGGAGGINNGGAGGGGYYGGGGGGSYRYVTSTGGAGGGGGGSNLVPTGGTTGTDTTGIAKVVLSYQDTTLPPGSAPTISNQPLAGDVNQPYSYTFSTTGNPSPTVSQSSGTLPPGLTLAADGRLSGTPTHAGTYSFAVRATNASGTATESVTMSIRGKPVIRIAGSNVAEGNSGTHPLTFRVTLNHQSPWAVSVHFATAISSARSPSDYYAKSGTLTFSPGQTAKTVTVSVRGDRTKEKNEVFFVLLSQPSRASIGTASGIGGILNDD